MEEIVLQLLNQDVAVRGRGFVKLTEAYKKSSSMSDLFKILHSSPNPRVRQYAAVLLKKRLVNAKHWSRLPQLDRTDYKAIILKQLINEEVSLRSSIVDLTIIIANHELTNSTTGWPELFESIKKLLIGEISSDKEVGISLLPAVAANRPETLMHHTELIVSFLTKTLHSLQELNNTTVYNILLTILHLAPMVEDDQNIKNAFHETMPQVIFSIQALTEFDKDQASEVLELLEGLCKNLPEVISVHTAILVTTCISIAENKLLDDTLRVKGLRIIKLLVDTKNMTIRNNELVVPIIDMIYTVMSEPVHNELRDFYLNAFTNSETPMTCGMQILDIMSQHLPSQELVPEVLQRMEMMFEEPDIYVKRGCYVAMAVVVEHCSKFIEKECLETFLKYVRYSFTDSGLIIRNVVQFTLGRFTRYLELKNSEYATELLPILCQYLDESRSEILQDKDPPTTDTLFYMLNAFFKSFADQIVPYLPRLIDFLFDILESNTPKHVKKLALKSFSSATDGVHEEMLLYLPRLITILNSWVAEEQIEEAADLQAQIFDTLSSIGRRIGQTEIVPVGENFLKIGVEILQNSTDPILKKAVYNYFAETSHTAPTLVAETVSQVFDNMIKSVQIAEISKLNRFEDVKYEDILLYQESDNDTFAVEENDDNVAFPYEAESSYIEEKKGAIVALGVLAVSLGESFHPYLQTSYREVFKRINYPEKSVSQSSLYTLSQFFEAFSKVQSIDSMEMMHSSADILIPILLGLIYKTNDSSVLEAAMITYSSILEFAKSKVPFERGHKDATRKCIIDIIAGNTKCQNQKETNTERDYSVKYYAGAMIAKFQRAIRGEESLNFFEQVLPLLLRYAEEGSIKRERSFGIEIISQSIERLGHTISKFAPQLVPLFVKSVADPDTELRCEAFTAILRLTYCGGDAFYPYYPDMLQALITALPKDTDYVTRDKLISVIKAVFGGILSLSRDRHTIIYDQMQSLMKISVNILRMEFPVDHTEIEDFAREFLGIARLDYADIWDDMGTFLSPEELIFVQTLDITEPTDMGIFV